MSETVDQRYPIFLDESFSVFDQSFNRIKYFSNISDALTIEKLPSDWSFKAPNGLTHCIPTPQEPEHLISGFQHFLNCYLLRDTIESFSLCLDNFYFKLLLNGKKLQRGQRFGDVLSEEEKKKLKKFSTAGLFWTKGSNKGKVQRLEKDFSLGLSQNHKEILKSLRDIRTCFAHSNGFVRNEDGQECADGKRKFIWKFMHIYGTGEESGKEYEIEFGKPLVEDMQVMLQIKEKSKEFQVGEHLAFSSMEIFEVGFSLNRIAKEYLSLIERQLTNKN